MDDRNEFLKTWYTILWSNINRSMTSIWEIVGPIALVGGAFLSTDRLGLHLTVSLQLVVVFWALNNTLDMNAWHRRNLIFAARVERQFLRDGDYGSVIPSSFREPKTSWIAFYSINFAAFVGLLLIVIVSYGLRLFRTQSSFASCSVVGPGIVLGLGIILTAYTYHRCEKQICRYITETQSGVS